MNPFVAVAVLVALCCAADANPDRKPPKIQLYSRDPAEYGKENVLICNVSEFHPPDITIILMKNDEELPSTQTDLAFNANWQFHLTRSTPFIPSEGGNFVCHVKHGNNFDSKVAWEPNM